jgi:hypothetical protein
MNLRQQMVLQQLLQMRLQMQAEKLLAAQRSSSSGSSSRLQQQLLGRRSRTLLLQQQLLYQLQPSRLPQTGMLQIMPMPAQQVACSSRRSSTALCKLVTSATQRNGCSSCRLHCSCPCLRGQTPRQLYWTLLLLPLLSLPLVLP